MVDELTTMGIETMVTFWPFQSTESRHWKEFSTNGYLVNKINKTIDEPTSYDGGNQCEATPTVTRMHRCSLRCACVCVCVRVCV